MFVGVLEGVRTDDWGRMFLKTYCCNASNSSCERLFLRMHHAASTLFCNDSELKYVLFILNQKFLCMQPPFQVESCFKYIILVITRLLS